MTWLNQGPTEGSTGRGGAPSSPAGSSFAFALEGLGRGSGESAKQAAAVLPEPAEKTSHSYTDSPGAATWGCGTGARPRKRRAESTAGAGGWARRCHAPRTSERGVMAAAPEAGLVRVVAGQPAGAGPGRWELRAVSGARSPSRTPGPECARARPSGVADRAPAGPQWPIPRPPAAFRPAPPGDHRSLDSTLGDSARRPPRAPGLSVAPAGLGLADPAPGAGRPRSTVACRSRPCAGLSPGARRRKPGSAQVTFPGCQAVYLACARCAATLDPRQALRTAEEATSSYWAVGQRAAPGPWAVPAQLRVCLPSVLPPVRAGDPNVQGPWSWGQSLARCPL